MKFRVAEIFGPTIQGEGRHVGVPCYFIRFGGCDFRCNWCDSLHAVLPEYVSKLPQLTEDEILTQLKSLPGRARWVVYSGGNPALLDLRKLSAYIMQSGYRIMVETQGTVFKPWLKDIDELCISPKPPSSGMNYSLEDLTEFLDQLDGDPQSRYLKIPVFDEDDYEYARTIHTAFPELEMFVSVGNEMPPHPDPRIVTKDPRNDISEKTRWLMEKVANDSWMRDVRVFPQLHVLAWGNERAR